jgi:hypothetical protein
MSVHLKGMPILDPTIHDIARQGIYKVKAVAVDYGNASTTLFTHPANTILEEIEIVVDTAWAVAAKLQIGDGTTVDLYGTLISSMNHAGSYPLRLGLELSSAGSIVATLSDSGAAAGSFTAWATYRPNSTEQNYVAR